MTDCQLRIKELESELAALRKTLLDSESQLPDEVLDKAIFTPSNGVCYVSKTYADALRASATSIIAAEQKRIVSLESKLASREATITTQRLELLSVTGDLVDAQNRNEVMQEHIVSLEVRRS